MRYRTMATYRGVPYEAGVGPSNSDVVLFAACPPPEELGFEPATGHWRKQVIRAEVDALWESRPAGIFRGEPCIVLDDLGDRLHIAYLGTDAERAAHLGYWQVDRGVFELLTPREEVTGLTEERLEKPLLWTQPQAGHPVPPAYPYGTAPQPEPGQAEGQPGQQPGASPVPPASGAASPGPATTGPATSPGTSSPGGPDPLGPAPVSGDRGDPPVAGPDPARMPSRDMPSGPPAGSGQAGPAPPQPRPAAPGGDGGSRSARRQQRVTTREIFCELADLAAIPRAAYALEAEVDGAMCLLRAGDGWEVFTSIDGARHEARFFTDEEAACFYLFGVLAADAIRHGLLAPSPTGAAVTAQG